MPKIISRDAVDTQFNCRRQLFTNEKEINEMRKSYALMRKCEWLIKSTCNADAWRTYINLGWLLSNIDTIKERQARFVELKGFEALNGEQQQELSDIYKYLGEVLSKTLELQNKADD